MNKYIVNKWINMACEYIYIIHVYIYIYMIIYQNITLYLWYHLINHHPQVILSLFLPIYYKLPVEL